METVPVRVVTIGKGIGCIIHLLPYFDILRGMSKESVDAKGVGAIRGFSSRTRWQLILAALGSVTTLAGGIILSSRTENHSEGHHSLALDYLLPTISTETPGVRLKLYGLVSNIDHELNTVLDRYPQGFLVYALTPQTTTRAERIRLGALVIRGAPNNEKTLDYVSFGGGKNVSAKIRRGVWVELKGGNVAEVYQRLATLFTPTGRFETRLDRRGTEGYIFPFDERILPREYIRLIQSNPASFSTPK